MSSKGRKGEREVQVLNERGIEEVTASKDMVCQEEGRGEVKDFANATAHGLEENGT